MKFWLRSLSVNLIVHLIQTTQRPSLREERRLKSLLNNHLLQSGTKRIKQDFLYKLPPFVLNHVGNISVNNVSKELREHLPQINEVYDRLVNRIEYENDSVASMFGLAETWAYHMLYGCNQMKPLLYLGKSLFKQYDRFQGLIDDNEKVDEIWGSVQTLRDYWTTGKQRLDAIDKLSKEFVWVVGWDQVKNIMYHHQFAWPLLIIHSKQDRFPISLPILVDVDLDGKNQVNVIKSPDSSLRTDQWENEHLRKAVTVGKKLWRSKHGYTGTFKDDVIKASVTFDFSYAEKVVGELGFPITLKGASAETYLAQIVLNRLLGKTNFMSVVATGIIGDEMRDQKGGSMLNYAIDPPGGVVSKLRYVFESDMFDRVVLPDEDSIRTKVQDFIEANRYLKSAEVLYAPDMHTLSDISQIKGWRQYQYVRCPDVRLTVHKRENQDKPITKKDIDKFENIFETLSNADRNVVTMGEDVTPLDVGRALRYLNMDVRNSLQKVPPSLSWAFIRILEGEEEQDSRFWHLIWNVVGARQDKYYELLRSTNKRQIIEEVSDILNRSTPNSMCPSHRTPDIIVVVGSKYLKQSMIDAVNALSRPLMVYPILSELNELSALQRTWDSDVITNHLGQTRIILIPELHLVGEKISDADLSDMDERKVLKALTVFHSGFTQHAASLVLKEFPEYRSIRTDFLDRMVEKGALQYGQGEYHIPPDVRFELQGIFVSDTDLAMRYYRAGSALAPYVWNGQFEFSSLSLDRSFDPMYYHEAAYYFNQANKYANLADKKSDERISKLIDSIRYIHNNIVRFCEVPNLSDLRKLSIAGGKREAYEYGREMLDCLKMQGEVIHPVHFVTVAEVAIYLSNPLRKKVKEQKRSRLWSKWNRDLNILKSFIKQSFEEAFLQCSMFPEETDYNELFVLTRFAHYLMETGESFYRRTPERMNQTAQQIINRLLEQGLLPVTALDKWIERVGDEIRDHASAYEVYYWGIGTRTKWAQTWVKFLGAASILGRYSEVDKVLEMIRTDRELKSLIINHCKPFLRNSHEDVQKRWEEGKFALRKIGIELDHRTILVEDKQNKSKKLRDLFLIQ